MLSPSGDAVAWRQRLLRASAVLLVAFTFTAATPLVADPWVRAGATRRVRSATMRLRPIPEATARLRVPFLRQEHALSCEAAALRMILAYRGVEVEEDTLLAALGVDPTLHHRVGAVATWGDPDDAFVGDVDGVMGKTGYGVHAGPVGRIAGRYRRAEVFTDATPAALTAAIAGGNPVIVWGFIPGRGQPLRWRTLGGKEVRAIDGEHTRVVVGYTGTAEAPTGFLLLDPIYGEQYWKVEQFMRNWEPLGRSGVVVY